MAAIVPTIQLSQAIAFVEAVGNIEAALNTGLSTVLASAPNQANGDAIPTTGVYISGDGVVKYAKGS